MRSLSLTLVFVLAVPLYAIAQPTTETPPVTEPATEETTPAPAPAATAEAVPEAPAEIEPEPAPEPAPAAPPPPPPPLMITAGELTLRPRLQARARYEGRINPYGDGVDLPDQHFITARARIGLDARWRAVRIVAEIQDVGNYGTFPGADDGTRLALHQGFLEVGTENAYMRLGRQEVALGDERFVGALDWLMAARSFDALRVHFGKGIYQLDVFGAMMRGQATYNYTGTDGMPATVRSRGDYFAFAQLAIKPSDTLTVEAYTLYRHDGELATAPTRDRDIVAPGVRLAGKFSERLSYMFEGQAQFGQTNGENHVALAGVADLRYALPGSLHPFIGLGGNYATGNHSSQRFDEVDNFFPTNHKFYGYADLFGLRNLIEGHAILEFRPEQIPVRFFGAARLYALENAGARWTNAAGAQLGVSQTNDNRFMGAELDATFAWTAHERLVLSGGYSVFMPAEGAQNLGHDNTQHWFYVMLTADTQ